MHAQVNVTKESGQMYVMLCFHKVLDIKYLYWAAHLG